MTAPGSEARVPAQGTDPASRGAAAPVPAGKHRGGGDLPAARAGRTRIARRARPTRRGGSAPGPRRRRPSKGTLLSTTITRRGTPQERISVTGTGFLASVLSIVVIDLTLAGDNAVVIAMAARRLPADKRRKAIFFGALAAVVVRVLFTFIVAQLLTIAFVKLIGGLVILWVALKLFSAGAGEKHVTHEAKNVWEAVKIIVIADVSMGVDNMLAVGGASHGNLGLLLFGLGLSIPFLVFASDFLSRLMDRYPVIVFVGAAILGQVAGSMIMTDPTVVRLVAPPAWSVYVVEALLAGAIIAFGISVKRRLKREQEEREAKPDAPSARAVGE